MCSEIQQPLLWFHFCSKIPKAQTSLCSGLSPSGIAFIALFLLLPLTAARAPNEVPSIRAEGTFCGRESKAVPLTSFFTEPTAPEAAGGPWQSQEVRAPQPTIDMAGKAKPRTSSLPPKLPAAISEVPTCYCRKPAEKEQTEMLS